jgi:hypothetical protein
METLSTQTVPALISSHPVHDPFVQLTQTIDKPAATKRCRRKITEGQWTVLNFSLVTILAIYGKLEKKINTLYWLVENSIHENNFADDR